MSAYREIKTQFRNKQSLLKALDEVGLSVRQVSDKNDLRMQGFFGSAKPVAIRLPKSHYGGYEDVGFELQADGSYKAIVSTHDGHGNIGEGTLKKITQQYSYFETLRLAKLQGYTVQKLKSQDGTIKLQLAKY